MKTLSICLSIAFSALVVWTPSTYAAPNAAEKIMNGESIGKLTLGQNAAAVEKILGKPESKGENAEMGATGEWEQSWNYPSQGVEISMGAATKNGAKKISSIRATEKCKLATSRGIKIGSSEADVKKAYAKEQNKEDSRAGESFVAGSIYGGVMFDFKSGKVTQIFLGAGAE